MSLPAWSLLLSISVTKVTCLKWTSLCNTVSHPTPSKKKNPPKSGFFSLSQHSEWHHLSSSWMGLPSCWVILLNIFLFSPPFFFSLFCYHPILSCIVTCLPTAALPTSLTAFAFAPVRLREVMLILKQTLLLITLTFQNAQWYPLHSSYSSIFRTLWFQSAQDIFYFWPSQFELL